MKLIYYITWLLKIYKVYILKSLLIIIFLNLNNIKLIINGYIDNKKYLSIIDKDEKMKNIKIQKTYNLNKKKNFYILNNKNIINKLKVKILYL